MNPPRSNSRYALARQASVGLLALVAVASGFPAASAGAPPVPFLYELIIDLEGGSSCSLGEIRCAQESAERASATYCNVATYAWDHAPEEWEGCL